MSVPIVIDDRGESRRVAAADFPLSLGGGEADIRLPGIDSVQPVAWLGMEDGEVFVQVDGGEPVVCNGTPVTTSQWLHDGDVLRVGATRIALDAGPDSIRMRVEHTEAENVTEPPTIVATEPDGASAAADGTTIAPVAFTPRGAETRSRLRPRFRPLGFAVWTVLALLGIVAWFVITARTVEVEVEPAPDRMTLTGGFPGLELDGRHLLRPGTYVLVAEKEGFQRLEVPVLVTDESNQSFVFGLRKLPGSLVVDTGSVEGAEVAIDGEVVGLTPLDPLELAPGEHDVGVRADRYEEYATRVSIEGAGSTETLTVELSPRWSAVTFLSVPGGATVRVDDEVVGTTPVTVDLLAGRHRFELDLDGHKPYRGKIDVEADRPRTLPTLRLELFDGRLIVNSEPPGATVLVAGVFRGRTPLDLRLAPGREYTVDLSMAGYDPESRAVRVESGKTHEVAVALAAQKGEIEISASPSGAELYVDDESLGPANQTLHLVAVPHRIEIRMESYESYRTTVTPRPGFPQSIEVTLKTSEQIKAEATPRTIRSPQGHEMVLIEGGRFRMGASRREPGRRANESLHDVELTRPFYLATTEVSNREFREFQSGHLSGQIGGYNLEIDDRPVVRVTWQEAARYCNWLSEKEGLPPVYRETDGRVVAADPISTGYRLPTEAEWAWAARFPDGRTALKYPWGDTLPVRPGAGNYADMSAAGLLSNPLQGYDDHYPATAPVDSFEPNGYGLFNIGGNVAEWVHDIYSIYPSARTKVEKDPVGPGDGELHVIRGSSWMDSSVSELRLTYRDYATDARPDVGFRVARYLE